MTVLLTDAQCGEMAGLIRAIKCEHHAQHGWRKTVSRLAEVESDPALIRIREVVQPGQAAVDGKGIAPDDGQAVWQASLPAETFGDLPEFGYAHVISHTLAAERFRSGLVQRRLRNGWHGIFVRSTAAMDNGGGKLP